MKAAKRRQIEPAILTLTLKTPSAVSVVPFTLKSAAPVSVVPFTLKTPSAVSVWEIWDGTTLKALRQAQDKLRVLRVDRWVARSVLGRFAAFGPPTRNPRRRQSTTLKVQTCLRTAP